MRGFKCVLLGFAIALPLFPTSAPLAQTWDLRLGPGVGVSMAGSRVPPCEGELLANGDGTWESGYAWEYQGQAPPDYGSFAEGYTGIGWVCGLRYFLSTLPGYFSDQVLDAYVYDSDGQNPDHVLSVTPGIHIDPPAIWPEISVHDVDIADTEVNGDFFAGIWGSWYLSHPGWFSAADTNGPPGLPRTKIHPGGGYPSGWQDPEVVWGPTAAMGVAAWLTEVGPVAARSSSWGAIKRLYRGGDLP